MNYNQTLDFLFTSLPCFEEQGQESYKPGLDRVAAFARHLGNPQRNFFTIHVAGTNGKGSVSHILASILQQAGYRTGLFTSPHLSDFRERVRVDGEMMAKQKVVNFVDKHHDKMVELGLSFFEMSTVMAFDYFDQSDVEVAIIETGLGGRLDATNIIIPIMSIITNVEKDHCTLLGETIEQIAAEKAGIIKKSIPVVIGEGSEAYNHVFEAEADRCGSRLVYAEQLFQLKSQHVNDGTQLFIMRRSCDDAEYRIELDLMGNYQAKNIITASAAADLMHRITPLTISRRAYIEGCRTTAVTTSLMGRWQRLDGATNVVCDTAHNPAGMKYVAEQLKNESYDKLYCVVGFCGDKDAAEMLQLLPQDAKFIYTKAASSRAMSCEKVAEIGAELGLDGEIVPTVAEALAKVQSIASDKDMIFVGGSNYVVAEIL